MINDNAVAGSPSVVQSSKHMQLLTPFKTLAPTHLELKMCLVFYTDPFGYIQSILLSQIITGIYVLSGARVCISGSKHTHNY
jgi:hypothetical protein